MSIEITIGLLLLGLLLFIAVRFIRNWRQSAEQEPIVIPDSRDWRHLR